MNQSEKSSEPPEEPQLRSEYSTLSPASPKPVHFPQPTNIPILDMQMDVAFNQTEIHMSDPSMHDTALRPDAWKDPAEQTEAVSADAPFYVSIAEATNGAKGSASESAEAGQTVNDTDSLETAPNGLDPSSTSNFNGTSYEAQPRAQANVELDASSARASLPALAIPPSVSVKEATAARADEVAAQPVQGIPNPSQSTPIQNGVDVQALLDTLSTSVTPAAVANSAPTADGLTVATTHSPSQFQAQPSIPGAETSSPLSTSGLGVPPSGLPPRPPPQEQPLIHPNYAHSQHIRDYHPHASNPAYQPHARTNSAGNIADAAGFVSSVHSTTPQQGAVGSGYGYPGQNPVTPAITDQSAVKSPLNPQQSFAVTNTTGDGRRESKLGTGERPTTEDAPWTADIQRKYDHFLEEERRYVNEARWDQFPQGSRLFVGNLSSEKVTKRDIFHVFHNYGELAQISIKQAYGFVQFLRTEDCSRALDGEQGRQIRDKKIHLEISKPQKNGRSQGNARRSRSPDFARSKPAPGVDRYVSGSRRERGRDGYRPGYRSPSPRGYRDRYDRYRTRSRSPGYGRGDRYRAESPRRDTDDDLPLPHRQPRDVPDVQIIVLDQLERDFISWVEKAFSARSVRVDVLHLSPRLSEEAVVRRQIMEGVVAVSKLKRMNQETGKIGLTVFTRQGGSRDVQFEEYDNLDPNICVELVLREKQSQVAFGAYGGYSNAPLPPQQQQQQQQQQQYGYQQPPYSAPSYPQGYGQPSPFGAPSVAQPAAVPPHLQSLITNMDPNNLQSLLSTLNQASPNTPQTSASAGYGVQPSAAYPPPASQGYSAPQSQDPLAALRNNPALMGLMAQQQQQAGGQHRGTGPPPGQTPITQPPGAPGATPNMQDIIARLGSYRQ